jgi:hypothetical protein
MNLCHVIYVRQATENPRATCPPTPCMGPHKFAGYVTLVDELLGHVASTQVSASAMLKFVNHVELTNLRHISSSVPCA